jgi:hypothetical protein
VARYFPQTSWTLIEAIRGGGDAAAPALAELTSRYYRPAHAYITAILRDQGMLLGPDQTEELTQGFFTVTVVSGRLLSRVDRAHGGFRPYLKQAIRNYLKDWVGKQARTPKSDVCPDIESGGWDAIAVGLALGPDDLYDGSGYWCVLSRLWRRYGRYAQKRVKSSILSCFWAITSAHHLSRRLGRSSRWHSDLRMENRHAAWRRLSPNIGSLGIAVGCPNILWSLNQNHSKCHKYGQQAPEFHEHEKELELRHLPLCSRQVMFGLRPSAIVVYIAMVS